jgi:hypothetical protein
MAVQIAVWRMIRPSPQRRCVSRVH